MATLFSHKWPRFCGSDIYSRGKPLFSSFGEHTVVCGSSMRQAVPRPRHRQSVFVAACHFPIIIFYVAATCRPSVLGSATKTRPLVAKQSGQCARTQIPSISYDVYGLFYPFPLPCRMPCSTSCGATNWSWCWLWGACSPAAEWGARVLVRRGTWTARCGISATGPWDCRRAWWLSIWPKPIPRWGAGTNLVAVWLRDDCLFVLCQ